MNNGAERIELIENLHKKYAGIIFDMCIRILKDHSLAEDAVQETFLNAYRSLESFTYGESHLPWLYKIGTNVCLKILRTSKKSETLLDQHIDNHSAGESHLENTLDAKNVLIKLANKLDDKNMEILISYYINGMKQSEIADMLGISRRAVVKRLFKLRKIAIKSEKRYE